MMLAAYASLALMIGYGVLRARAQRAKAQANAPEVHFNDLFAYAPSPDPLVPRVSARRTVRWCEARATIEAKCQRCHGSVPANGAPFSLLTYADTQREHAPGSGIPMYRRMSDMIRERRMPPVELAIEPAVEPLDLYEQDVLLVWLEEGAFAYGGEACATRP